VIEELRLMGVDAWCGRKIEFKRSGKKRYAEAHESPFLPNYLFMTVEADQFTAAVGVKYLAPTLMMVPLGEVAAIKGFKDGVQAQYEAAERIDANSRAAVAEYTKGQRIEAINGHFMDLPIWFSRVVQGKHDAWPRVEGHVDMMGGRVPVQFDPLDVRALP
jgi:hypothetical protein